MVSKEIEQAIDRFRNAILAVSPAQTIGKRDVIAQLEARASRCKDALIALLARDDARIARLDNRLYLLEKLEAEARHSVEHFGVTSELHGINSWLSALDALDDADAPGGG